MSRRPPPPPPPADDGGDAAPEIPPPLPSRNAPGVNRNLPKEPGPPALPERRPQHPSPGLPPDDDYEDMNTPAVVSKPSTPRTRRKGVAQAAHEGMRDESSQGPSIESMPGKSHKKQIKVWNSIRELGHKLPFGKPDLPPGKPEPPPGKPKASDKYRKISTPALPVSSPPFSFGDGERQRRITEGSTSPLASPTMEDTYEEPTFLPKLDKKIALRTGAQPMITSFQSKVAAENPDTDDGWSDSEWDEHPGDPPTPEDTYLVPDGGHDITTVSNGDYNDPVENITPPPLPPHNTKAKKPPINTRQNTPNKPLPVLPVLPAVPVPLPDTPSTTPPESSSPLNGSSSSEGLTVAERKNLLQGRFVAQKPTPPTKPSALRPTPNPKPKPSNVPTLPQRPQDKPSPDVPPLPPNHPTSKRDSRSDDNSSAGSTSSVPEKKETDKVVSPTTPKNFFLRNQAKVAVFPPGMMNTQQENKKKKELPKTPPHKPTLPSACAEPSSTDSDTAIQDDIYDDGQSENVEEWLHGNLDREEGNRKVKQMRANGAFLVRASKSDGSKKNVHPYTLVVMLDGNVYNLRIRLRDDNKYAIGNYKDGEVSFPSLEELVEHHKENNIKLVEGGLVKLTCTPKK